jgi:RNA polymerase sigma factor (sigma-70 family)
MAPSSAEGDDLALARACEAGDEAAWERFVREYRPVLQRAADAIDPSGGAREIADSLIGELYGRKLFRYFQGRSRLSTWLRAVLAQRYIDRIRELKKHEPLPESENEWPAAAPVAAGGTERDRFVSAVQNALTDAIAALDARDRLRIRYYYIEGMKLAAIGRLLNEHEATASRNVERTRRELRAAVELRLTAAEGFDARSLAECLDAVMNDPGEIDINELMGMKKDDRARSGPRVVQTKGSAL